MPVLSGRGHISEIKNWGRKRIAMDGTDRKGYLRCWICLFYLKADGWVRSPDWSSCKAPSHLSPWKHPALVRESKHSTTACFSSLVLSQFYSGMVCKCKFYIFFLIIFLYFCLHVCHLSVYHVWCPVRPEDRGGRWEGGCVGLYRYLKLSVAKQNPVRDTIGLLHLGRKQRLIYWAGRTSSSGYLSRHQDIWYALGACNAQVS